MGIYRTICYKVEDIIVKIISKKQDQNSIKEKVITYRIENEKRLAKQKSVRIRKRGEELQKQKEEKEWEKQEIEVLMSTFLENVSGYSQYEYNEVEKNRTFFKSLTQRVFEPDEKALTFIFCEFDKSNTREIKGYLIPTNKRILFLTKNLNHMEKFRYQLIINVNWFNDGILERGFRIQYGKRKLEFDEIFDQSQMEKVGNMILNKSTVKV